MTGSSGRRIYLDWNASAPLRPEARAAMLAAMDAVGNPSSVHAEGRAARAIVERARGQVAGWSAASRRTSSSPAARREAAALALAGQGRVYGSAVEHDAVDAWLSDRFGVTRGGAIDPATVAQSFGGDGPVCVQAANSETGVLQDGLADLGADDCLRPRPGAVGRQGARSVRGQISVSSRRTRSAGRRAAARWSRGGRSRRCCAAAVRSRGAARAPRTSSASRASARPPRRRGATWRTGVWERVERLRDALEERLESAAPDLILFGKGSPRLPNTSCFAVPGWAGETQVMQMDLAGFAVSAGSACSSGKVRRASRVLLAMGLTRWRRRAQSASRWGRARPRRR